MAGAVGVGGVFLQSLDAEALAGWYAEHFSITFDRHPDGRAHYVVFRTRDVVDGSVRENPVFSIDQTDGPLADPEERGFTLNLRVDDFDAVMERLRRAGADVTADIIEWEGGRHGWVRDLDGNRVEVYEELVLPEDSPHRAT